MASSSTAPSGTKSVPDKTFKHVTSYPLVADTLKYLGGFPLLTIFAGYFSLLVNVALSYAAKVPLLPEITSKVDTLTNGALSKVDAKFPVLLTFRLSNLVSYARQYVAYIRGVVGSFIVRLYKCVEVYADPVLKKGNDYYEVGLEKALPAKSKKVASSDELHRSYNLGVSTLHRLEPYARQVASVPGYVNTVYQDEKAQSHSTGEAVKKTTTRLSGEAYTTIKPKIDSIVGGDKTKKQKKTAKPAADSAKATKVSGVEI